MTLRNLYTSRSGINIGNATTWLIYPGGNAVSATISGTGEMVILALGQANYTTIKGNRIESGNMRVSEGGTANHTTIASGIMRVSSGGSVTCTTLSGKTEDDAKLRVFTGASAVNTIVSKGYFMVNGGTADLNTVYASGFLVVDSNGIANTNSLQGGILFTENGGTASDTTISSDGVLNVYSGGTAKKTVVGDGGVMHVEGATATSTYISKGGLMHVSGGYHYKDSLLPINEGVTSTTIYSGGRLQVLNGGMAVSNNIKGGGSIEVYGGNANITTVSSGGEMLVGGIKGNSNIIMPDEFQESDESLNILNLKEATPNQTGGTQIIGPGTGNTEYEDLSDLLFLKGKGTVTSTTLSSGGHLLVSDGGLAISTIIKKGGSADVLGGTANDTTVSSGGVMTLSGHLGNSWELGYDDDPIPIEELHLATTDNTRNEEGPSDSKFLGSDPGTYGELIDIIPGSGTTKVLVDPDSPGFATLGGKGYASNTIIKNGGELVVSQFGSATGTIISSGGVLRVNGATEGVIFQGDGKAQGTIIKDGGEMIVSEFGTAYETEVKYGGGLTVSAFGYATSTTISGSGQMTVANYGSADFTDIEFGGSLTVLSNGQAGNNTVYEGGVINVLDFGGVADTTLAGGSMFVSQNGFAVETSVAQHGYMYVASDALLAAYIYENGGYVKFESETNTHFESNTFSDLTLSRCSATVHLNTIAQKITLDTLGVMEIYDGGIADNNCILPTGKICVSYGGLAYDTTISGGALILESYGSASYTHVYSGGLMYVSAGASALHNLVESNGSVLVMSDGTLMGSTWIDEGAYVSVLKGGNIDFTVKEQYNPANALINNWSLIQGRNDANYTITVATDLASGRYSLAKGASDFNNTITVLCEIFSQEGTSLTQIFGGLSVNGSLSSNGKNYSLTKEDSELILTISEENPLKNLAGTKSKLSWSAADVSGYVVQYSKDNFAHVVTVNTSKNGLDSFELPQGTYQWRVKKEGGSWTQGSDITAGKISTTPKTVTSTANGTGDIFFANPNGTWGSGYLAQHNGVKKGWSGTKEYAALSGKNKFCNLFIGSTDANVLVLTDNDNGDALFLDDIYSALPSGKSAQARLSKINEIRAGAGNDLIDLTSQQFDFTQSGLTVRGGQGDDVIWGNKGGSFLFGDAGNDRIVGGAGNDVIVGGVGNDKMHGAGGDDIFCFCKNWGNDTVEQLSSGKVTLWFDSGSISNWNASTLTYTDGFNSVKISGVTAANVTLKFGDEGGQYSELAAMGAFASMTSERILEDTTKGLLA